MKPKVSIIILNWNGLNDTVECIESIQKIDYPNYDVVVVDNNSSANDVDVIKEKYGHFIKKIIINKENLGFSGGNNVGIRYAVENGADFILLLNNDTVVEPDFLSALVAKSETNMDAGLLSPMIKYYSDKNKIWYAGGYISKIRASGISYGTGKNWERYKKDRYCSFATGCCVLIKSEVINKIGLFDEKYFLYLEDTDYSARAIKAGFRILYVSNSIIYHKVNATTAKDNRLLPLYYSIRNRLFFSKKNYKKYYYLVVLYIMATFLAKSLYYMNIDFLKTSYISLKDHFNNQLGQRKIFK